MKTGNVGAGQVVILLFVSRCFNILNYVPVFAKQSEGGAILLGNLLAVLIQAAILIPSLLLFGRFENQNVVTVAYNKWKPLGWIFAILYFAIILLQAAGSLVGFEYFMTNAVYTDASILAIVLSMSAVCFWCARNGLEGIARSSVIIFVFLLASCLFISAASIDKVNLLNIHPILNDPADSVIQAALVNTSRNPELFLLPLIYPKIKGSVKKCGIGYILAAFAVLEGLDFLLLSVLGDYGFTQTFPYYTLASIADTTLFQRLDSLHMVVWVFTSFIHTALLIVVGNYCIRMVLPQRAHKFTLPAMFVFCTVAAVAFGYHIETLYEVNTSSSVAIVFFTAVPPLILLCITKRKRKEAQHAKGQESFTVVADTE